MEFMFRIEVSIPLEIQGLLASFCCLLLIGFNDAYLWIVLVIVSTKRPKTLSKLS